MTGQRALTIAEAAATGSSEVLLAALRRPVGPEAVEAQVRRYIVERGLGPGDRLPSEVDLSATLGSSRLVIREALRALEAVGILGSRAGSGWFVRPFQVASAARAFAHSLAFHPQALLDLLAVRRAAEADLVASLAGRLGPSDLAALDELADRMRWRASRQEIFHAEDGEFHRRVLACTGNQVALALADLYLGLVEEMYQRGLARPAAEDLASIAEAHAAIVAALRAGDGAEASRRTREHHSSAQTRITAWLAAQEAQPDQGDAHGYQAALYAALLWPGPGQP
jgi:DNA-binding FadR family transcriptional regulator